MAWERYFFSYILIPMRCPDLPSDLRRGTTTISPLSCSLGPRAFRWVRRIGLAERTKRAVLYLSGFSCGWCHRVEVQIKRRNSDRKSARARFWDTIWAFSAPWRCHLGKSHGIFSCSSCFQEEVNRSSWHRDYHSDKFMRIFKQTLNKMNPDTAYVITW